MWNFDVLSTLQESKVRVTRSFQGSKQTLHHMDWSPSSPIFFSTQVTGGPNVKVQRRVRAATKRGSAALSLVNMRCQQKSPCFFGSKNMHVANQVWLISTFMSKIHAYCMCYWKNKISYIYTSKFNLTTSLSWVCDNRVCVCVSDLEWIVVHWFITFSTTSWLFWLSSWTLGYAATDWMKGTTHWIPKKSTFRL